MVTKNSVSLLFVGKIGESYVPRPHNINKIWWVLVLEKGRIIYLNAVKKLIFFFDQGRKYKVRHR
jgi:hypothetical protein